MDIKKTPGFDVGKSSGLDSLIPSQPGGGKSSAGSIGGGPSFQDTMNRLGSLQSPLGSKPPGAPTPASVVNAGKGALGTTDGIKFSNHAIERMRTRGISFTPEDLTRLSDAVGKAAAKGSKDSLVLMNDSALIVSVKNNTVVTVMDKNALKENVFTNIDSTIVM
jgi:flagellar operon protein